MNKRKLAKNTILKYQLIIDKWFVIKFNGAAAYRFYFPNVKKDETATVNFSKIQALPEIQAYIKEKHKEVSRIIHATHEGILRELLNWLEFDITETLGLSIDEIKLLPIEIRRTIIKHKTKTKKHYSSKGKLLYTEDSVELQFPSKERIIDMINKHIGFYEADNKQKSNEIHIYTKNEKHLKIVEKILNGEK